MKKGFYRWNNRLRTFVLCLIVAMFFSVAYTGAIPAQAEDTEEQQLDVQNRTGLEDIIFVEETCEEYIAAPCEEDVDVNNIYSSDMTAYWKSMCSDYIYEQLSDEEKTVWDNLEELCIQYAENNEYCEKIRASIGFKNADKEAVKDLVKVFYYSHPQYFFLSNTSGIASSGTTVYPLFYVYGDFCDGAARQAAVKAYKTKIDAWSAEVNACDTVVAKEKKAMEIIADNTIYSGSASLNQSTYSMVCLGKTVCAGYCGTFAVLMNRAGVETQVITGIAGEAHGWDTVNVHGVWYLVDPTWADQNDRQEYGYYYGMAYQYLNRADSTISIGRTRDAMWEKYYHPASYDSGCDGLDYVDPYFEEDNYKYFTVNNNINLGALYALPIEGMDGAIVGAAPKVIVHNAVTYTRFGEFATSVQTVSLCVDDTYDCTPELRKYTESSAEWTSDNPDCVRVENGVVTAKSSGTANVTADVEGDKYRFSIVVSAHAYGVPEFTWNQNYSACDAVVTCGNNAEHKQFVSCEVETKIIKPSTCVSIGTRRYTATAFGVTDTVTLENVKINPNNHTGNTSIVDRIEPTTSKKGYSGNIICADCEEIIAMGEEIDMLVTGWQLIDGKWYYYDEAGEGLTDWQKLGGKWYYFASSGAMATGWQSIGGKWYYFAGSGAMQIGWQKLSGKWYYFASSGAMLVGWQSIGGKWYYFETSGAMAAGWKQLGGKWYYFDANGAMVTGWQSIGGKWYYFETSGAMAANKWIAGSYYVKSNGVMATNEWIGSYYVDANGKYVPGRKK